MAHNYPPSFRLVSQDKAIEVADSESMGITKVPWGSKLIDTSHRHFWSSIDPEITAFYKVRTKESGKSWWWIDDLAATVVGRNSVFYGNTGWNMNSPTAVKRLEEVFAMLGLQECLMTCIGAPSSSTKPSRYDGTEA